MRDDDFLDDSAGLVFAPEATDVPDLDPLPPWKVMVVDDDVGVHEATRMALQKIRFRGRGIEFIDAYSGAEACRMLGEHDDVAVVFLDVVMETDDAGLRAARQIRDDGHALVRIILRTGHPGYAPEQQVVVDYDIHDYKEKTSLDYNKLFTCLISALRAYADLQRIEQHRRGLLSVLEAVSWFDFRALQRYLSRMLAELSGIAGVEVDDLVLAMRSRKRFEAAAAGGGDLPFVRLVDCIAGQQLSADENRFIADSFDAGECRCGTTGSTFHVSAFGIELVIFSRDPGALPRADAVMLELFLNKVAQALDNHGTFSTILSERDSLMRAFVMLGERWGGHDTREVARIQNLTRLTAERLQVRMDFPEEIDDWFVYSIATASSLHDLGLTEVPHRLFESPTALTAEERSIVREHVNAGVRMLHERLAGLIDSRLYTMAEAVVRQHHERHDGSGYPEGIGGDRIAVAARIVSVVDTYVAMTSDRAYRRAHSQFETLQYIRQGRGSLFDPRVADAFLEALDEAG
jgi:response regulator RpfG family c-di-GMP phosphodiesterase